ncbi:MAG: DUF3800 domain-containing protein [Clostridia bacterium]|nr:DUF3800 domain-containing protein [Clostridia bacterium]
MGKKEYIMAVDDSGYTYTEKGKDGKEHMVQSVLQAPAANPEESMKKLGQSKYFVGVLIPADKLPHVSADLEDASEELRISLLRIGKDLKEIHATELFRNENRDSRDAFLNYLQRIADITQKYELTIVVSPKDTTIRTREEKRDGILKNYSAQLYPYHPLNPSKKNTRHSNKQYQQKSLLELNDMVNMYLSDGGYVSTILCDEGLHKKGTNIKIADNTALMFLSSEDNSLIQFADNIAWLYNRVNEVVPDRVGRQKRAMLDDDVTLTSTYEMLLNHVLKHDETKQEKLNDNLLEYKQNYLPHKIYTSETRFLEDIGKRVFELPRVRIDEGKYLLTVYEPGRDKVMGDE